MKGAVVQKRKGSRNWYAIIERRDEVTGKRIRKWITLNASGKREAQIECARIITELKTGTFQEPSKLALADFVEQWLDYMKSQVSPATHERYVEIARKNIIPLLGQERLSKLSAVQITQAYTKALEWWSPEWKGRPFPAYRASHAPNSKAGTHESS